MKRSLIYLILLILPAALYAQGIPPVRMVPEVVDARSAAMGKTAIVSAQGSNAIFSNPALLATFDKRHLTIGGRLLNGDIGTGTVRSIDYNTGYSRSVLCLNESPNQFGFNSISVSIPVKSAISSIKYSFGLGYHTYFDGNLKMNSFLDPNWTGVRFTQRLHESLNVLSPAVAMGYKDKFYLGISYSRAVFSNAKSLIKQEYTFWDEHYSYEPESDYSAAFWLIGGLIKVTPKLNIALSFRSNFTWHYVENKDNDIVFPNEFGVGFDYALIKNIKIAGEYQNRKISGYSSISYYNDKILKDGNCYRVGVETRIKKHPVRLGYFSDAIPVSDYDSDKHAILNGVTGGFGLTLYNKFTIDQGFEWNYRRVKTRDEKIYYFSLFAVRMSLYYSW
jgi:hypothetical protein